MLIETCWKGEAPGYRYCDGGSCFSYLPNNIASREKAFKKAEKQGREIRKSQGKVIE